MPPRLNEFRTVLGRNGFELARSNNHEVWIQRVEGQGIPLRVMVSHGNGEIRTRGLFSRMLRQAGKTEEHFYEVLNG